MGPVTAAAGIGAAGSILGGRQAQKGAEAAAAASERASVRAQEIYTPYREAGERSLSEVEKLAKGKGEYLPYLEYYVTGEGKPFDITTSPMYKYQLEKGTESIGKSLAARGLYGSGAGVQAETELAEKLGVGETEKMYGRLMDLYNIGERKYGKQMDIARLGAGAAGGAASATQAGGARMADIEMQKGAGQAGMYSDIANIGMAGVGAYQQQKQYGEMMDYLRKDF